MGNQDVKRQYDVKTVKAIHLSINNPLWNEIPFMEVTSYQWDEGQGYRPNTKARLAMTSSGLSVWMQTDETPLLIRAMKLNEDVYKDSCMEFFIKPSGQDPRYLNFEINPAGTLLIGIGPDRNHRERITLDSAVFQIESRVESGCWTLCWIIPISFLQNLGFPEPGEKWYGNFYKCGDETIHPHYGSWNPILLEKPDFHVPDYFGEFIAERVTEPERT